MLLQRCGSIGSASESTEAVGANGVDRQPDALDPPAQREHPAVERAGAAPAFRPHDRHEAGRARPPGRVPRRGPASSRPRCRAGRPALPASCTRPWSSTTTSPGASGGGRPRCDSRCRRTETSRSSAGQPDPVLQLGERRRVHAWPHEQEAGPAVPAELLPAVGLGRPLEELHPDQRARRRVRDHLGGGGLRRADRTGRRLVEVEAGGVGSGVGRVAEALPELHVVRRHAVLGDVDAFELDVRRAGGSRNRGSA